MRHCQLGPERSVHKIVDNLTPFRINVVFRPGSRISCSVLDLVLFRVISNSLHADILFQKDLKLGRPWTGTDITDLGARYAATSKYRSVDLGVEVPSMRIATPAVGIVHLFKLLETARGEFLC